MKLTAVTAPPAFASDDYVLDDQAGFVLRQANQRHTTLFAANMIEELTPTQWAAMAKLHECGPCSQNRLGRLTAMDAATIKGVIDRLTKRGLTATAADATDARRLLVLLTREGEALYQRAKPVAGRITEETLRPLSPEERMQFVALLRRLT
jgi:DNA-binding MarR family transcriptional regulator